MKKLLLLCATSALLLCGCTQKTSNPVVTCSNGNFVGRVENNGVMSFKGIPYAKAPVGNLSWKAPQAPDPSDETFDAGEFGLAALQAYSPSEVASSMPKGLCLSNCIN